MLLGPLEHRIVCIGPHRTRLVVPEQHEIDDEVALGRFFDRSEWWRALRAVLQTLNFGVGLWALPALRAQWRRAFAGAVSETESAP